MTRRMAAAVQLADLTEKAWDAQLFETKKGVARVLGWTLVYHTLRSKGSRSGFPDRVLVRERVIFAEMKREGGKPTDAQVEWLTGLAKAGAEAYLWRPSDLDEIGLVLGKRWLYLRHTSELGTPLGAPLYGWEPGTLWRPNSLWLPTGRRADQHVQEALTA